MHNIIVINFPGGSDGKEFTCSAGDLSLIPGLGRSPGGEHVNPLQYSQPGESPWTEEPGGLQSIESQRVNRMEQLRIAHSYSMVACRMSLSSFNL